MRYIENDNLKYKVIETASEKYASVLGDIKDKEKITIPSEVNGIPVKTISFGAFKNNENLTEVIFEEGVELIEADAFRNCRSLSSVSLPKSLKTIGHFAFDDCVNLEYVFVQEGLEKICNSAFSGCFMANFYFPESLKIIGDGAFFGSTLYFAEFKSNLKSIGYSAFRECNFLKDVKFSEGLKTIGGYAFADCTKLQNISFPDSVETIGTGVIDGCRELTSVSIGKNATISDIEDDFASECPNLQNINISSENEKHVVVDGVLYDLKTKTLVKVPSCLMRDKIYVPKWVENVANTSLEDIKHIETILFSQKEIEGLKESGLDTNSKLKIRCYSDSDIAEFAKEKNIKICPLNSQLNNFLSDLSDGVENKDNIPEV